MTTKQFVALGKGLLSDSPEFVMKGRLMVLSPLEHILKGICFEPSSFDKDSFYVNVFVLPLFVPTKFVHFLFGGRIRSNGRDRWGANIPNLIAQLRESVKREALPFLSQITSVSDFVKMAKSHPSSNPHTPEAIAFALARAGWNKEAIEVIDQLLGQVNLEVSWQREMADMAQLLKSLLLTDPAAAQRQLDAWEAETVKNLGLEEFR